MRKIEYEPSFDGLRAIAVCAVVACHASERWFPGGWAGVDVFFVLSGYLITRILKNELQSRARINLKNFYMRRVLRLVPAFMCLLAMYWLASIISGLNMKRELIAIAMSASYLMNWNRAFDWLPQGYLGHTWSLAVEEQFYFIWPVALNVLWRRRPVVWILSGLALVFAWRLFLVAHGAVSERTYNGFDTHADGLLMGCALAFVPVGLFTTRLAMRLVFVPIVAFAAIVLTVPVGSVAAQTLGISLSSLISVWFIVAAAEEGWFKSILSLKPFSYTGCISYGIYLWHYPILLFALQSLPPRLATASVLLAYPIAAASHRYVEVPFLKLKTRFTVNRQITSAVDGQITAT